MLKSGCHTSGPFGGLHPMAQASNKITEFPGAADAPETAAVQQTRLIAELKQRLKLAEDAVNAARNERDQAQRNLAALRKQGGGDLSEFLH